jgi:hypothetical protein
VLRAARISRTTLQYTVTVHTRHMGHNGYMRGVCTGGGIIYQHGNYLSSTPRALRIRGVELELTSLICAINMHAPGINNADTQITRHAAAFWRYYSRLEGAVGLLSHTLLDSGAAKGGPLPVSCSYRGRYTVGAGEDPTLLLLLYHYYYHCVCSTHRQ